MEENQNWLSSAQDVMAMEAELIEEERKKEEYFEMNIKMFDSDFENELDHDIEYIAEVEKEFKGLQTTDTTSDEQNEESSEEAKWPGWKEGINKGLIFYHETVPYYLNMTLNMLMKWDKNEKDWVAKMNVDSSINWEEDFVWEQGQWRFIQPVEHEEGEITSSEEEETQETKFEYEKYIDFNDMTEEHRAIDFTQEKRKTKSHYTQKQFVYRKAVRMHKRMMNRCLNTEMKMPFRTQYHFYPNIREEFSMCYVIHSKKLIKDVLKRRAKKDKQ